MQRTDVWVAYAAYATAALALAVVLAASPARAHENAAAAGALTSCLERRPAAAACVVPTLADNSSERVVDIYARFDGSKLGGARSVAVNRLALTIEPASLCLFATSGRKARGCDPVVGSGALAELVDPGARGAGVEAVEDAAIATWFLWEDASVQVATDEPIHLGSVRVAATDACALLSVRGVSMDLATLNTTTNQTLETLLGGEDDQDDESGGQPVAVEMNEFFSSVWSGEGGGCKARRAAQTGGASAGGGGGETLAGYIVPLGGFVFVLSLAAALRQVLMGGAFGRANGFRRVPTGAAGAAT